jgi:hypothetical protein
MGTFVNDQNQTILCRSRVERTFLKIWSLYNVGNGLYSVFTTAKMALSFQQKRAFIQKILFLFFKWDTLAQKKGHVFHLCRGGDALNASGSAAPGYAIIRSSDFDFHSSCITLNQSDGFILTN